VSVDGGSVVVGRIPSVVADSVEAFPTFAERSNRGAKKKTGPGGPELAR